MAQLVPRMMNVESKSNAESIKDAVSEMDEE